MPNSDERWREVVDADELEEIEKLGVNFFSLGTEF